MTFISDLKINFIMFEFYHVKLIFLNFNHSQVIWLFDILHIIDYLGHFWTCVDILTHDFWLNPPQPITWLLLV